MLGEHARLAVGERTERPTPRLFADPPAVTQFLHRLAERSVLLLRDAHLPRELDFEAVGDYLALGWIPGEATPFRAIRRVRPGCRVLLAPGAAPCRQERYWQWPRFFGRSQA